MRIETVAEVVAPIVAGSRTIDWGDCAQVVIHSLFATIGNPSDRRPTVAAIVPTDHPNKLRAAATLCYAATPFALRGAHSRNRGSIPFDQVNDDIERQDLASIQIHDGNIDPSGVDLDRDVLARGVR